MLPDYALYYVALHVKLASSARMAQLVEIFAYESPTAPLEECAFTSPSNPIIVYQFHNLFSQERLFVFTTSLKVSQ